MKSINYVIAATGLSTLLVTSDGKSQPRQTSNSQEPTQLSTVITNALAVRYDAGSNVAERIVKRMKFVFSTRDFGNKCVDRNITLERPNQKPIRCSSLEDYGRKMEPQFYYGMGWHFQPIPGTNLWTAIEFVGLRPYGDFEHKAWGIDGGFKVHVFNEKRFFSTKQLNPFSPPGCNGFAEFRFDSTGRNLLYRTKDGYEIYDLLGSTVKPYNKPPPEWRVLLLADFQTDQIPIGPYPEPHPEKYSQH